MIRTVFGLRVDATSVKLIVETPASYEIFLTSFIVAVPSLYIIIVMFYGLKIQEEMPDANNITSSSVFNILLI